MKKNMAKTSERAAAAQPIGEQIRVSIPTAASKSSKIVAPGLPWQYLLSEKQSCVTPDQCQVRALRVKNTFFQLDVPDVDENGQFISFGTSATALLVRSSSVPMLTGSESCRVNATAKDP